MAKKTAPASTLRLKDKKVAISGTLSFGNKQVVQKLIEREGGTVAPGVSATIDYLILGGSSAGGTLTAEKKARDLIQNKGAAIQILDEQGFQQLLAPTLEEAVELLRGGPKGIKAWNERYSESNLSFQLLVVDEDFRNIKLNDAQLSHVTFQRCDFRKADLSNVRFNEVTDCQFDEAKLTNVQINRAEGCRFVKADLENGCIWHAPRCVLDEATLTGGYLTELADGSARGTNLHKTRLNSADFGRADLTGAKLTEVMASYTRAQDACFENADLSGADLDNSKFIGTNFRGANLSHAKLEECDFSNADLSGANLEGARLGRSKFPGANLKGANLREVHGSDAEFTGASLEGADFTGANVIGCKFDSTATAVAIGLTEQSQAPVGAIGPNVRALEKAAQSASHFEVRATLEMTDGSSVVLQVYAYGGRHVGSYENVRKGNHSDSSPGPRTTLFSAAMQSLANRWGRGTLQQESVTVTTTKSPLKKAELQYLALCAWCEVLGVPVPTEEELKQGRKQKAASVDTERTAALELIRTGKKGIKEWNDRSEKDRLKIGQFRKADLSGLDLSGVNLDDLDLQGADFNQSKLSSGRFVSIDGKKAKFDGIQAKKANFGNSKLADATFIKADLTQCNLRGCSLLRVDFTGADLTKTDFSYSNLPGANFTDCDLSSAVFDRTVWDEKTVFPAGYTPGEGLIWNGAGKDPRLIDQIAAAAREAGPIDFESFMKNLEDKTDASKLANAMKMLKADKFNLFANTDEGSVTGVVKSQSDPTLVYACRLDSAGEYACCTQNLNICGGLRGSLCKHLLVLLVGLTSGGALDPTKVHAWMSASRLQKPKLDKDLMSEIFLKYKGAEAGEIDWRPTETVPEDFYAF